MEKSSYSNLSHKSNIKSSHAFPFKSKMLQDECSPEALCRVVMYALHVKEEFKIWPDKSHRQRSWLTIPQAIECCRHMWMREALQKGISKWYADGGPKEVNGANCAIHPSIDFSCNKRHDLGLLRLKHIE